MQPIMNIGMKGLIGPMMMMMIMMMKVNNITSEQCHLKLNQHYTPIIIPNQVGTMQRKRKIQILTTIPSSINNIHNMTPYKQGGQYLFKFLCNFQGIKGRVRGQVSKAR